MMLIVTINKNFNKTKIAKCEYLPRVVSYFKFGLIGVYIVVPLYNLNRVIINYSENFIRVLKDVTFLTKDLTVNVESLNDCMKCKVVVLKVVMLIVFLMLMSCASINPRLDITKNPTCSLDHNDEYNYFDNSGCVNISGSTNIKDSTKDTYYKITFKLLNNKRFLKRIYQHNFDEILPGAIYYAYVKNSDEKWNIYKGTWRQYIDPRNGVHYEYFNDNSHVLLHENVERNRLPIEMQTAINDSIYDPKYKKEAYANDPFYGEVKTIPADFEKQTVLTKNTIKGLIGIGITKELNNKKALQREKNEISGGMARQQAKIEYASEKKIKEDEEKVFNEKFNAVVGAVVGTAAIIKTNKDAKLAKRNAIKAKQVQEQSAQNSLLIEERNRQFTQRESENSTNKPEEFSLSSNSNSSNQNKSYKKRTNLPSQNGCISLVDSNKKDITSTSRWFILKNSCAYSLRVSWCVGIDCSYSTSATTISGGASDEHWGEISSDDRIHLNYLACQLLSGNEEVYSDWPNKQCWANVKMQ